MLLKHYFLEKIAHSSYILAGKQTCAVIDPRRDVDMYINEARELGVTITHILETHLHADFISGHMDLAARTGARIYAPKAGNCRFEHVAVSEGDSVRVRVISESQPWEKAVTTTPNLEDAYLWLLRMKRKKQTIKNDGNEAK